MNHMEKYCKEGLLITDATLLSAEEAEALPQHLKPYKDWWWLREPGLSRYTAASICRDGSVYYDGRLVDTGNGCVRPALQLAGLEPSDLMVGDRFELGGIEFAIVSNRLAFCTGDIGCCAFRKDWKADDANVYEASDVKRYVDNWFREATTHKKPLQQVNDLKIGIRILFRDIHGGRRIAVCDDYPAAYEYVHRMADMENSNEYKILAVFDGVNTLYSSLLAEDVSWEDLLGFFA